MERIVGKQDRTEFEPRPAEAWRRGRRLDAMLSHPQGHARGVFRASHAEMNRIDDQRALEIARRLNGARPYRPDERG